MSALKSRLVNFISKFALNAKGMLLVAASSGPLKLPLKYFFWHFGRRVCKLGMIPEAAVAIFPLAKASPFRRVAPYFENDNPRIIEGMYPEINAYLLEKVIISAYSSHIVKDACLLVPKERFKHRNRIPSHGKGLGYYNELHSICTIRGSKTIEKAIFVGGDGADNWYHYVIECMSKAYLIRLLPDEFQDYPIIVPDEARCIESFAEILDALVPDREVLTVGHSTVNVENLIVLDDVSSGPFNLLAGCWPMISDYSHHENILNSFVHELRKSFSNCCDPQKRSRRIFLVRPDVRRNYNQEELLAIAKKYGFSPIAPETLSLKEQAKVFSEASHIVGASGAAWTNMLFAPHPFRGLTWIIPTHREFCSYSMLAHFLGHDVKYLVALPDDTIRSTGDASRASYTVTPSDFEAAIVRLVSEV